MNNSQYFKELFKRWEQIGLALKISPKWLKQQTKISKKAVGIR